MLHLMTQVLDAPASWAHAARLRRPGRRHRAEVLQQAARFAGATCWPRPTPGDLAGCTWSPTA
jgi:hypothetical protein